ncbi:MAG: hypothetical protein KDB66_04115 [Solirubrobacterales bacterium]|nr:hypothetical protein [Solirubrobacterales bacterium]MCB8915471.1 hypothetical protein [Thermoleophilales bacterium]
MLRKLRDTARELVFRRPARHSHWREIKSDKATAALAVGTVAIAGAVVAAQYTRLLSRRTHSAGTDGLIDSAPAAAMDTVGVAVEGYSATPNRELVLFNLLSGFLGSFAAVRLTTWAIREDWGPFRNVSVGGRHIHHFVPGILIAFGSGIAALLTSGEKADRRIARTLGVGMGLTFDEAALLLDLQDVYWTRQGLLSVQISLATGATLGASILTMRILGRGETRQEEAGEIPVAEGQINTVVPWPHPAL